MNHQFLPALPALLAALVLASAPVHAADRGRIVVPEGTTLEIELTRTIDTNTARNGDPVTGQLHSDVLVDGWRALPAGSEVRGRVEEVVSGGNEVGGSPRLRLRFDTITTASGIEVPIKASYKKEESNENAEDAAKVLGGAAAGAVIGHQVDEDQGTLVGGVLGGAAGAVAAKKTGGEVKLKTGTVITVKTKSITDYSH